MSDFVISWDYLAGFFDGEGTLPEIIDNRRSAPHRSFRWAVYNTNLKIMEEIRKFLTAHGIRSGMLTSLPRKAAHSISYQIYVTDVRSLMKLLKELEPRTCVKHRQVCEAMAWATSIRPATRTEDLDLVGAVSAYGGGMSAIEVERKFGVSCKTLYNRLKRNGTPLHYPHSQSTAEA